jgi:alpha-1,2-mannosyltransferase
MSNSSWTQAHFTSLLAKGRNGVLAFLFLMDETALQKNGGEKAACDVVFPPCDTGALSGSKLDGRSREIVSLAQFRYASTNVRDARAGLSCRPEKEHWKQIDALAILFERHPGQRAAGVKLVLMGGARHPADEQRVTELRELARMKGVKVSHTEVVSPPSATLTAGCGRVRGQCAVWYRCGPAG